MGMPSCKSGSSPDSNVDITATQTPVTFTHITQGPVQQLTTLNATSAYLKKNAVRSSVNGYILHCQISPGEWVRGGQELFVLETREAMAIGRASRKLDSTLGFSGQITIKAPQAGFVTSLFNQAGDYVMDGDSLCYIADKSSFVFLLDVPVEWLQDVALNAECRVILPDGEQIPGRIISRLPSVDPLSQTQRFEIRPLTTAQLPENLVAKVQFVHKEKKDAITLPTAAILSNEAETHFWVMKLVNDTTAIRVPVKTGMVLPDRIEILSPRFTDSDSILLTGNYGLNDTALVRIEGTK